MAVLKSSCPMSHRPIGAGVRVSALRNVRSQELHSVNLFDQLATPTAFSDSSWVEELARIRAFYKKELSGGGSEENLKIYRTMKAGIPAILPAGEFSARRDDALLRSSGFMQFDIDAKDNPGCDLHEVKWTLAEMEEVAYVGTSVSGEGIWGLVRISSPAEFHSHGKRLLVHLKHHTQVQLDEPVTLRKSGLRLLSYDEKAWINPNAKPFALVTEERKPRHFKNRFQRTDQSQVIEQLLSEIEEKKVDITSNYEEWVRMLFALSTAFGADGLDYAHRLSQFYTGYDEHEVDRAYRSIDSSRRHPVSLRSIIEVAKSHLK